MRGKIVPNTQAITDLETAVIEAVQRKDIEGMTEQQRDRIVRDPKVCHGQATVRGTRILVSIILDALADCMTEAEILAEYPTLTVEGIRAAAAYGAELARDEYPAVATS